MLISGAVSSPFLASGRADHRDSRIQTRIDDQAFTGGKPELSCDAPVYHFGKAYKYENIRHCFVIQNRGRQELEINKIETSCGCVVGETSDKKIAPGMSGKILVNFRTGPETGTVRKKIRIYASDPGVPVSVLHLAGEVREDITVTPRQMNFGNVVKGEEAYGVVHLRPYPGFPLEIEEVVSSHADVCVSYRKDGEQGDFVVDVTLKKDAAIGIVSGNISIFTNSERQKRIIVPVYGEVLGDIRIYPQYLHFGTVKKDHDCVKSVFLTLLKKEIRVDQIRAEPGFLVSEVETEHRKDENATIRILTRIKKDAPAGKIKGIVKVYTNSKIQPTIRIPVSGEIGEK